MKELIATFYSQIERGIQIFTDNTPSILSKRFDNIVISGLGGSGIGGSIIRDLSVNFSTIPVVVNKDYQIPAFVNEKTLFIASSYSGDTEETLYALNEAVKKGATILCISSGGKIETIAKASGYPILLIPGGGPPRAHLGYSITQLICILVEGRQLPSQYLEDLKKSVEFLKSKQPEIQKTAEQIANNILNKSVIIYSDTCTGGVAERFRQQLNENAKILCWHHCVPEMNHNELVGWTEKNEQRAILFLRNHDDFSRNQSRIEINKEILTKYTSNIYDIWSIGSNKIEQTMYFIQLVDWVSYYLSELRGVDIMDIKVIDHLKKKLSELN